MTQRFLENPVLIERDRGGDLEAWHRGAYCAVRGDEVLMQAGQVDAPYFMRSAAKFFQALPAVLAGVHDRFRLNQRELALLCASHGGEPCHVEVAARLLAAGGLEVDDLICSPHPPMHAPSAAALMKDGSAPTRLHNNCSGKHAGMLLGILASGGETSGYANRDHPYQIRIADLLARFAGIEPAELRVHVDGCGAPTFNLPLKAAARAYGNFGRPPEEFEPQLHEASAVLRAAVTQEPLMIAGHDRFCTALIEATRGRVLAKMGADGFYGATIPGEGIGIALHIDDGSIHASERVLARLLVRLGAIGGEEAEVLGKYVGPMRRNHAGDVVGSVRIRMPDH